MRLKPYTNRAVWPYHFVRKYQFANQLHILVGKREHIMWVRNTVKDTQHGFHNIRDNSYLMPWYKARRVLAERSRQYSRTDGGYHGIPAQKLGFF